MVGRLEGTLDGRPVALLASGDTLTLRIGAWTSARAILRARRGIPGAPVDFLRWAGIRFRVQLPGLPPLPAFLRAHRFPGRRAVPAGGSEGPELVA